MPESQRPLDEFDVALIESLQRDARQPLKQLADEVGLSSPSVSERIRRLLEKGIVTRFTLDIDPAAVGFDLQAIVRITPLPGKLHIVERLIGEIPEVLECDKVTGDDCFVVRLCVGTMADLDRVLGAINDKASTSTSMVKRTTVRRRLPPLRPGRARRAGAAERPEPTGGALATRRRTPKSGG